MHDLSRRLKWSAQLSADATVGVVTGVDSATVNALLYQRVASATSGAAIDVQDPAVWTFY